MSDYNPGPSSTSSKLSTTVEQLTNTEVTTFALLPPLSTNGSLGRIAFTSDQGMCYWNGLVWVPSMGTSSVSSLTSTRVSRIAAFNLGAAQQAPAWAATTAYVVNNCVTNANGQVLCCQTAGTSGSTNPVYTPSNPFGRPLADGTVVWGPAVIRNAQTNELDPLLIPVTITQYASAGAAGLTETQICTGTGSHTLNPNVSLYGAIPSPGNGYQSSLGAFTFAAGLAAGGGNATAAATALGYSALYGYQTYSYDVEWYCTDTVVAVTHTNNINQPITVEVDGVTMQANPTLTNGTAGCCTVFDFGGVAKRRLVRWVAPAVANTLRGYALSTTGYIEPSDTSTTDNMLWMADSIAGTVASDFPANSNAISMGAILKRLLGLSSVITVSVSGSGYAVANPNEFTMTQILSNSENQRVFSQYTISHVLHTSGFNDRGQNSVQVQAAAATSAWTSTRSLFPNAKITVTDGFSQAAGPDANGLATAAALKTAFSQWNDPNSRFIQSIGPSASTAWVQGTSISTGAVGAGNSCWVVGALGTHCTGYGALYQSQRLANAIQSVWNGAY